MATLRLETQRGTDGWVITVEGDVDLYSSPELRSAIMEAMAAEGAVAVDLSRVRYMDSSGVATLVEGLKGAMSDGTEFRLLSPSRSVMKVLELSRLDTIFEISETT
jgi:anti-sigma B factor antagonist